MQFAIVENRWVVSFDPETAQRSVLGESLREWAEWVVSDPDVNGTYGIATAWQDENGALEHDQRLIQWRFFVMGGQYELANLVAKESVECMRIRGPIARSIHDLPNGARIEMSVEDGQRPAVLVAWANGSGVRGRRSRQEHQHRFR